VVRIGCNDANMPIIALCLAVVHHLAMSLHLHMHVAVLYSIVHHRITLMVPSCGSGPSVQTC